MKIAKAVPDLSVPFFLICMKATYIEREVPPHEVLGVLERRFVEVVSGLLDQLDESSEEFVFMLSCKDLDLNLVFEESSRVVRPDALVVGVFLDDFVYKLCLLVKSVEVFFELSHVEAFYVVVDAQLC